MPLKRKVCRRRREGQDLVLDQLQIEFDFKNYHENHLLACIPLSHNLAYIWKLSSRFFNFYPVIFCYILAHFFSLKQKQKRRLFLTGITLIIIAYFKKNDNEVVVINRAMRERARKFIFILSLLLLWLWYHNHMVSLSDQLHNTREGNFYRIANKFYIFSSLAYHRLSMENDDEQ